MALEASRLATPLADFRGTERRRVEDICRLIILLEFGWISKTSVSGVALIGPDRLKV